MRYLLPFFLLILFACGNMNRSSQQDPQYYRTPSQANAAEMAYEAETDDAPPTNDRLLIFDAYLRLKVKNADGLAVQMEDLGKSFGGYLLERSLDRVRLRVPADSLETALAAMGRLGKIESQNVTGRDVTDQHTDLQLRLDNARQARQRYLSLLDRAQTVSEILPIEKELERLLLETESLHAQLKRLDELIAFSTITVDIEERVKPGPLGWVFVGVGKAVKWLIVWD